MLRAACRPWRPRRCRHKTPFASSRSASCRGAHAAVASRYGSDVSFFVVRAPAGAGPLLHRHPYEETFVLLAGSATFTVDGVAMEGVADTVIVVPAGAAHKFVAGPEGLTSVNVHPRAAMEQEDLEGDD